MTRRLTVAIVGVVAAALLLAGLGTLLLNRISARQDAEREAREQAEVVATMLGLADSAIEDRLGLRERLELVRNRLEARDIDVIVLTPQGGLAPRMENELPAGLELTDLRPRALVAGATTSGHEGAAVYAAAPVETTASRATTDLVPVVVITRAPERVLGAGSLWFLVASAATLALGTIVAWRLGRHLSEPLIEARDATARIAGGDLAARVPVRAVPGRRPDELDELATSINEMASALDRSRRLDRQFLMSVSHDLRTPLTSVRGYAEAIADGTAPDDRHAALVILAEARRLDRLVRDLLDLAKLDAHQFGLEVEDIDIVPVLEDVVNAARPEGASIGVTLTLVADGPAIVAIDRQRMGQVLANLVENALKYATHEITVVLEAEEALLHIVVADDGPGIADEDLPHVFDRLYVTAHAPPRREAGSGLGLAIVRELVSAMGGSVRAARGGTGTRMTVTLPRAGTAAT